MRILIYGAGVLGSNLARNLHRAGKDVTLLARGDWAKEIEKNGLRIKDRILPRSSLSHVHVITSLEPEDRYDVIFVVLRYTQIPSILDILKANRTKNLVFVGNNVRASELSASLPEKNVLFGFAFSAGHREKDRVVSIDFRKIMIGPLKSAPFNKDLIRKIFADTGYQVIYQPNMEDYLLCHAAFVVPVVFACYKTEGNLKKLRHENDYLNQVLDATIEGYRAVEKAGHEILPQSDKNYEGKKYHRTCFLFLKLMCGTVLGKICVSDHAMNAVDEMSALNEDLKAFFNENGAEYPIWKRLEEDAFLQYKSGKPHEENRTP